MSSLDKDGNEIKDGFRPRKKRTKADMKQLIKDGVVRDPDAPPEESRYGDGPDLEDRGEAFVVRPPSARLDSDGKAG